MITHQKEKDQATTKIEPPFEVSSIISISGHDLDGYIFRKRTTAPTFYGIVENMASVGDNGWGDTNVSVAASRQYQ